ncbi:HipA N-terminal domain-containing protein [Bacteroidales bacterium OttesenSCG-928-K03]|nr:HipA N-terminal domain-containing protein [Odoribacter sp. OttesenSCG-928-L07]MDL2238993.1 HipA N-terminal domain-containing protein [Bacteroidales bacterium OttesenSCG-928-L14]MDL2240719.1 HipA N-terminal domain-containing protein [Bacteroidales bacterium OttesenSCG-928-K22]MDL2243128.1 HipA N-terminal domain-containing protein [Bacteroidales bacterium OttesenSCG-928-K03]
MRSAKVYINKKFCGTISKKDDGSYIFRYDDEYFQDENTPSISLNLSKKQQEYFSETLFSFFFNMLSEGKNNSIQTHKLGISKRDYFGLLLATAKYDTIGAITLEEITE